MKDAKLQHVVLTTDLSEESLRSWPLVRALAERSGARVTLLHVATAPAVAAHGMSAIPTPEPEAGEDLGAIRAELESRRAALEGDVDVEARVVHGASVPAAVASFVAEHAADLLAVSTHGRSGVRRMALGSVAESLLRSAEVPVLVLRADAGS